MLRLTLSPSLVATLLWIIVTTASAGTHTWTGANGGLWSDPLNWIGGAPQTNEPAPIALIIPASAPGFGELTNDVPGLVVSELTLAAHANTLHALPGVMLILQDGTLAGLGISTILAPSFAIELEGVNHLQGGSDFYVRGPITERAPGASLHVSGNVVLQTSSTHSGSTYFTNGVSTLSGAMTNAAFLDVAAGAQLTIAADFTVLTNRGRLAVSPESHQRPETSRLFGEGFVCIPGSTMLVSMVDYPAMDSEDPADGGNLHSRLVIDGPVVLAGELEAATDLSQDGLRFGIIQNRGSFPTLGQFDDVPEGALIRVMFADLMTQRVSYRGGEGKDVTATFVQPPDGRRLAGPFLLGNGWLQILSGIGESESLLPHRWDASTNLVMTNGWTALGPEFLPGEEGTLLTLTNAAAVPLRFFRLVLP